MNRQLRGFTLIELMIVVVIISILAAIGYPSYLQFVNKSRRSDAQAVLLETSQRLERCYSMHNKYDDAGCAVALPLNSPEGYYTVTGVINSNSFTLTATPTAGGPQVNDGDCTTLSINQLNQKTATGADAGSCW